MKKTDLMIDNQLYKNIYVAESFWDRLKGLMFISEQKAFSLLIKDCNSVHTCFMNFPITIICLNKEMKVIKIIKNIKPFKFIFPLKNVKHIIEIPEKIS
ncbi:DUF192 domain-containing protein [Candidatus Ruminimicrobium bovinum]|uniref:DUF192 domain-containing protein n=1 Tax=Candidatus Ruminimicrobium bovinum TaxID=3242779 RepID=UPI0039B8A3D5